MREITKDELQEILTKHRKWCDRGDGGERANLAGANLAGANLAGANLAGANLARANLARANLADANLARADLAGADLAGADLAGANLAGANLAGANLAGADLARANLADANLARADLAGADLDGAYLADAYLADADLDGAYLGHNKYVIGCTLTNYQMVMFKQGDDLLITCGCRRGMSVAKAREHWSPDNKDMWTEQKESWGQQRLAMIDFLEAQAKVLGWEAP